MEGPDVKEETRETRGPVSLPVGISTRLDRGSARSKQVFDTLTVDVKSRSTGHTSGDFGDIARIPSATYGAPIVSFRVQETLVPAQARSKCKKLEQTQLAPTFELETALVFSSSGFHDDKEEMAPRHASFLLGGRRKKLTRNAIRLQDSEKISFLALAYLANKPRSET